MGGDMMSFERWLADLLGQDEQEVRRLLQDETATHFMVAWSLFESKCFNGFCKMKGILDFSDRIVRKESFKVDLISTAAEYFHARYQSKRLYKNLMHKDSSPEMDSLLQRPFVSLRPEEMVFLAALTAYRFRNNIFHGNKEVGRWLKFTDEINHCIGIMQAFVSHAEQVKPSLRSVAV
jgi:hypothetical protein